MDPARRALLEEMEEFGRRKADESNLDDRMLNVTPDTGEFLALLVRATRARAVLELGTSNGYSTVWLADSAEALGGKVTTVDFLPHKAELARANLARAGLSAVVEQHVAEAGEFLRGLPPGSFDFVFLDAYKDPYVGWWPSLQRVMAPGALLVADNALSHAEEMAPFLDVVRRTPGYLTALVPVGMGEFLALKAGG